MLTRHKRSAAMILTNTSDSVQTVQPLPSRQSWGGDSWGKQRWPLKLLLHNLLGLSGTVQSTVNWTHNNVWFKDHIRATFGSNESKTHFNTLNQDNETQVVISRIWNGVSIALLQAQLNWLSLESTCTFSSKISSLEPCQRAQPVIIELRS